MGYLHDMGARCVDLRQERQAAKSKSSEQRVSEFVIRTWDLIRISGFGFPAPPLT
jgi:hypothetical protein